jgi:hypothetical protein
LDEENLKHVRLVQQNGFGPIKLSIKSFMSSPYIWASFYHQTLLSSSNQWYP